MRYGPDGDAVKRIYEVAKEQTGGKALTGFWSNKNWLADLEGERSVDIVGHSERWPLFFEPPYKYRAAGDPQTDDNPGTTVASVRACFHSNDPTPSVIPTILGQFDLVDGTKLLTVPIAMIFGKTPGHARRGRATSPASSSARSKRRTRTSPTSTSGTWTIPAISPALPGTPRNCEGRWARETA